MTNTRTINMRLIALSAIGILILGALVVAYTSSLAHAATGPNISAVSATSADTTATVTWTTDVNSSSQVTYGTTSGGESATTTVTDNTDGGVMNHTAYLGGLTPNMTYYYEVLSQDPTSGLTSTSSEYSFTTTNTGVGDITASTTAPMISSINVTPTDTGATVTWTTDQSSNSQVEYGTTNAYGNTTTLADTNGVTSHTVLLTGLTPNTTYHFAVMSGNGSTTATSNDATFVTTETGVAPVISNIIVTPTSTGATITWNTDQSANSQVEYGTDTNYGNYSTLADTTGVTSHTVTLSNLAPNTTYHYVIWSSNMSGTMGSTTDATFTTSASTSSTPSVTTNLATNVTDTDATLNATNGPVAAQGESFWVSTSPIDTSSSTIPSGVYSTPILSGVDANATFSDPLSLVTTSGIYGNMPALTPDTTYYVVPWIEVNGTWYPGQQTTVMTTDTASSTDTSFLQSEITNLQNEVATLQAQLASLMNGGNGSTTNTGSNTNTAATIDQNNMTMTAGGSVDFSGRNFDREENVTVMLNGNTVATAHADGGGNFSTGSIAGPTTAGSYTYTFLGADGDQATATINVQ